MIEQRIDFITADSWWHITGDEYGLVIMTLGALGTLTIAATNLVGLRGRHRREDSQAELPYEATLTVADPTGEHDAWDDVHGLDDVHHGDSVPDPEPAPGELAEPVVNFDEMFAEEAPKPIDLPLTQARLLGAIGGELVEPITKAQAAFAGASLLDPNIEERISIMLTDAVSPVHDQVDQIGAHLDGFVTDRLGPLLEHSAHWTDNNTLGIDPETHATIEDWASGYNALGLDPETRAQREGWNAVNWREDPGGDFDRRWYGQN